jgi:hypothetical protein
VFEYHGAEHKTISCFEAGPLTPGQRQRFSRLHPRCGTSFLLVVMIVAIFVFAPIGLPAWYWLLWRRGSRGARDRGDLLRADQVRRSQPRRRWVQVLMWPGLKLQLLTTREPDLDQLAVAISALQAVLALETPGSCRRPISSAWRSWPERRSWGPHRLVFTMIEDLVKQIETRFAELGAQMTDPEVISDRERYAEVGRAYSQLEPAAKLAAEWRHARDDAAGAEELLAEEGEDAELREELSGARSGSRSSRRRSAWRWSSATPTTTRT